MFERILANAKHERRAKCLSGDTSVRARITAPFVVIFLSALAGGLLIASLNLLCWLNKSYFMSVCIKIFVLINIVVTEASGNFRLREVPVNAICQ